MKSSDQCGYKKKELIGKFVRDGTYFATERIQWHDHDFPTLSDWKVIPFGIYDIQQNKGTMTLNMSHDTSELNCDAIGERRLTKWKQEYSTATEIVIFADCGWSNSYRSLLYKHYLQLLANKLNINIRITHYPPYTSKYNLIEHRMFCHVHRSCEWVMFTAIEIVQQLMAKTRTNEWLTIEVWINKTIYETWRKIPKEHEEKVRSIAHHDDILPNRNYVIKPNKEYQVII